MSRQSSRPAALLIACALVAGACPALAQTPPAAKGAPAQAAAPTPAPAAASAPAPAAAPAAAAAAPAAGAQPAAAAPAPGGLLVPGSEFRYDSAGRRDPFKSLLQLEQKQRDLSQLPPIQQVDLEQFRVVGIVTDPKRGAQAMVKAGNQTFVVRVGTVIGKNEGEITEITLKGIRVIEKFLDFMNRETRKETFLKSHPTAGK
jgi:hypothetical protein